ncbi:hypothetical protein S83_042103, partial [Arachis hypogaea]
QGDVRVTKVAFVYENMTRGSVWIVYGGGEDRSIYRKRQRRWVNVDLRQGEATEISTQATKKRGEPRQIWRRHDDGDDGRREGGGTTMVTATTLRGR